MDGARPIQDALSLSTTEPKREFIQGWVNVSVIRGLDDCDDSRRRVRAARVEDPADSGATLSNVWVLEDDNRVQLQGLEACQGHADLQVIIILVFLSESDCAGNVLDWDQRLRSKASILLPGDIIIAKESACGSGGPLGLSLSLGLCETMPHLHEAMTIQSSGLGETQKSS